MLKGGFLIGCDGELSEKIAYAIESTGQFTTVVKVGVSIGQAQLAFVSLHQDHVDFVGVVRPGRHIATGLKTISVSHLVPLGVAINSFSAAIAPRFLGRIALALRGIDRLPPKTWDAFVGAIQSQGKKTAAAIRQTRERVSHIKGNKGKHKGDIELFEHDAVATALEVWGGTRDRKRILRSATLPATDAAPFLTRLTDVSLREDPQIIHDAETIPGMKVAKRYQIGIAVLDNNRERLTIINCNRQPLEATLGVDLVYYSHRFRSFVLVQYKRMSHKAGATDGYRPSADASYKGELARMKTANCELRSLSVKERGDPADFRLMKAPFYFKLCSARSNRALEEGMVSGMYVPLMLWQRLMKSDQTMGSRGGRFITWDNCTRRFNNSEFTSLLRAGWIGSAAKQTDRLNEIITAALDAKRMVVYAATSKSSNHDDYVRDDYGRFASDDDPLATR